MPEPVPATLAEALAALQGQLPRVAKDKPGQAGQGRYLYADLTDCSDALYPLMSKLGLAFTCRPTLDEQGRFVLAYALLHSPSNEKVAGAYPLPTSGSPQQIGGAITYARRYTLCAVTGLAPGGDDDDAASAEAAHHAQDGPQQLPRTGTNAALRQQGRMDRKQKSEHERLVDETKAGGQLERDRPRGPDPDDPWAQDAPVDHQRAEALRRDLEDRELPEDKPGTSILAQQTAIAIALGKKGITSRDDKFAYCGHVTGRDIASSKDLSYNEAEAVLKAAGELETTNA